MTYHNNTDAVDFESAMDFNKEVSSCVSTRFERRKNNAMSLRKTTSAPLRSSPSKKRSRPSSSGRSLVR